MNYEKILIDGVNACRTMKHDDLVGGLVDYFLTASGRPAINSELSPKSFLSGCLGQAEAWRDKITNQLVNDKLHHERELSNYIVRQEFNGLPIDKAAIDLIDEIVKFHVEQIELVMDNESGLRYHKLSPYIKDEYLRCSVGSNRKISYWEVNLLIGVIAIARFNASKTDNRKGTNLDSCGDEKYIYVIKKEIEDKLLINYNFWRSFKLKHKNEPNHKNIYENVGEHEFFNMISYADFSRINVRGMRHRVLCNINILSRLLGKEWGANAAELLDSTLEECQKRTDFAEWQELQNMYL